jgi:zinc transporter, ZIP family
MSAIEQSRPRQDLKTAALFLLPLLALAAVIGLFLRTSAALNQGPLPPPEQLTVERYTLERGRIDLLVRNGGPVPVAISQVVINDAIWPFTLDPAGEIPRLGTATLSLDYMWSQGEAYAIRLFTSNAIAFSVEIPVAVESALPSPATFLGFTLIGVYVGIIPVFLGILWYPALRRTGRRTMTLLLAATLGLLIFLGIDTLFEAREASLALPDALQGVGLIAIGVTTTFLLLEGISQHQRAAAGTVSQRRYTIAYVIATGIGFHNLGEGLAIGAAYNLGELALGQFLVVGFIIQNITEGLGVVAPLLRERPSLRTLVLLGMIAGAPAVAGTWIGGLAPSPVLAVLFLAIGAGAIFQVAVEVGKLLQKDSQDEASPQLVFGGVVGGMLMLWVTGLLIK